MRASSPSEAALFPVIFSLALASSYLLLGYRTCGSCQTAGLITRGGDERRRNRQPSWLRPSSGISQEFLSRLSSFSGEERSIGVDASEIDLSLRS
jgi:hypothetical protein